MPAKVVDTSVLAALVFGEEQAAEALGLIEGFELYAPILLSYELTSVARKKSFQYPTQREAIAIALELGLAMNLTWVDVDLPDVLAAALSSGLTTYDATYLNLARSMAVPLVTFDKRLVAAHAHDIAD